jgi:aspartate kinase
MKVYKFGGASVASVENIINVCNIIRAENDKLVVVVSALGKTTNAIEKIIYSKDKEQAIVLWDELCDKHRKMATELECEEHSLQFLNEYQSEGRELIYNYPRSNSDEFYDQLISKGELMSTTLLVARLLKSGLSSKWMDARKMFRSDERFRSANIQWRETELSIQETINKHIESYDVLVTQGFIASTRDGRTTTLGREGSDYSAAIISYCIEAESMSVWKDVQGVLTGDPRRFPNASLVPQLSYKEAIEMTYYGAQVIHPKTIQPIQRKEIPLHVRSFIHKELPGTTIDNKGGDLYPPMIVVAENQYLLEFSSKDFSFIAERHLSMLFRKFNHYRIRVNIMRNTAISFIVCVNAERERLDFLKEEMAFDFHIKERGELQLVTIRHFNQSTIEFLKQSKEVLFEEKHGITYQMVVADI